MTTAITTELSPVEALSKIEEHLDLTWVKRKLADPEEGKGYPAELIERMDSEYRKFLALHLAHPTAEVVPCKIVDEMWHQHILDTAAYRSDCEAIFGRFLDHFPYFGMRGEEDAQALDSAYEDTVERYRAAFGEPPAETWLSHDAQSCKRTACKPQKCK